MAETHRFEIRQGSVHGCFSRERIPILTVEPGDTVVYSTLDADWGRDASLFGEEIIELEKHPENDQGHALCGPVAVRGARPGDVLEIAIEKIVPGHWGLTWSGPRPHLPRYDKGVTEDTLLLWHLDPVQGTAHEERLGLTLPLRPFMGVMGNAPGGAGYHSTAPPRRVGGNLDCRELIAGSILYLPIEVEGALFSVGDGHATQADGEVGQTAIECPMAEVVLRFGLRSDLPLNGPEAHTPAGYVTMGMGETLDDAAAMALEAMLRHMERSLGYTRGEALALASLVADLHVTQVVNGRPGVHAILADGVLPGRPAF